MKGSLAKAARVFDALRIKMEAGAPAAPVVVEETATPVAEVVTEAPADTEEVLTPVEATEEEKE
jgi:large subunit ribosomal protein L10